MILTRLIELDTMLPVEGEMRSGCGGMVMVRTIGRRWFRPVARRATGRNHLRPIVRTITIPPQPDLISPSTGSIVSNSINLVKIIYSISIDLVEYFVSRMETW